jgi:BRCA1-associated protein
MCETCGATDDLWMCLVCGFYGCGIEAPSQGHNREHYEKTKHTYSMEIITKIVYDFSKNGYVHRLLQNAADGKIMEADDREGDEDGKKGYNIQKKVETISHEYNLLLTSQVKDSSVFSS